MDRGQRRAIKVKKWRSLLRKLWDSHTLWSRIYKVKSNKINYSDADKAESWKDFEKDQFGVMVKNTRTLFRDNKRLGIREERKRNLENRKLNIDEQEELDRCIEEMENPFAFENYCCNCDNFPGDLIYQKREYAENKCPFKKRFENGELNGDTNWKQIGCQNFWD